MVSVSLVVRKHVAALLRARWRSSCVVVDLAVEDDPDRAVFVDIG